MSRSLAPALLASASLVFGTAQAQQQGPTDAQIAAIVVAANQVDIDAGKLAERDARAKDVKQFARQMVADHTAVNDQAKGIAKKLSLEPEPNASSADLEQGGRENLAQLRKLSGAAFDKAYVDHEVSYHQAVIDTVDNTLLPSTGNAELKALLTKVRPVLVEHLQHAKHLQAELAR